MDQQKLVKMTIENKQDLVLAMAQLFDDDDLFSSMTPKEINQELRDCGYDPEKIGKRMAAVAKAAFEDAERNRG